MALFTLRALQVGLTLSDLDCIGYGAVTDILIEAGNDNCDWQRVATQKDFDAF